MQHPSESQQAKLSELCSGSSFCPSTCKTKTDIVLASDRLDIWLVHTSTENQTFIFYCILVINVFCIHAAPKRALCWNTATNLHLEMLTARRNKKKPGFQFLALFCFLQVLMNRHFVIERSGASKIIKESPLQVLFQMGLHITKLNQCLHGTEQENKRIRNNIMFVSDCTQNNLDCERDKHHLHLPLHGTCPKGSRIAAAAKFPTKLRDSILDSIAKMITTSQGWG